MDCASDTDLFFVAKVPNLIKIAYSSGNLVLHLNKGILHRQVNFLISHVVMVLPSIIDTDGFLHEISDSIDGVFILRLIVMRSFVDCKQIKDVGVVSLINEELVLMLFNDNIPRV